MAASKRDFTNFYDFPGALNTGTGHYEFPQLRHIDDAKHVRQWQIYIRLIKKPKTEQQGIDWDLLQEHMIPIQDKYFKTAEEYEDIPAGSCAQAWAESGVLDGKITRNAPTYFYTVANAGRSNQRNQLQQALIYARSQYLKRVDKGGTQNQSARKVVKSIGTAMHFPMLATNDKKGRITYPAYIQPKLDGVRCLVFLKKKDAGESSVIVYSRAKMIIPAMDHLKRVLYPYLNDLFDADNNQSIFLDGELYKHGKRLQDISGESRNEKKRTGTNQNEYHIYDCFYPKELDSDFAHRHQQLKVIFDGIEENKDEDAQRLIRPVPTILVNNAEEAQKEYSRFVALGYEGAMLRNCAGVYLANPEKTGEFLRSVDLMKMKPTFTDEFEVANYTQGTRGKDKGAIIWVAKTAEGKLFNVTPKNTTYEERYALFKECKKEFNTKYLGRMLTVEYQDLSKDKIPQRAKALVFREYE